ncbi:MAG: dockerin type I domain-containing protein, partial [Planctomycetota bacterium]
VGAGPIIINFIGQTGGTLLRLPVVPPVVPPVLPPVVPPPIAPPPAPIAPPAAPVAPPAAPPIAAPPAPTAPPTITNVPLRNIPAAQFSSGLFLRAGGLITVGAYITAAAQHAAFEAQFNPYVQPVRNFTDEDFVRNTRNARNNHPLLEAVAKRIADNNGHPEPTGDDFIDARTAIRTATSNGSIEAVGGFDPNELIGPAGVGPANFIRADSLVLPYSVHFENLAAAPAPAQEVVVTQPLDTDLDFATFELSAIGFGSFVVDVPAGLSSFSTRVDAAAALGVLVDITAEFDIVSGILTARFTSIDPTTGDLATDPFLGFLPPNQTAPAGEGFVNYTVRAKPGLVTGTEIRAVGTIVFDTNPPITTNQIDPLDASQGVDSNKEALVTIDAGDPSSSVTLLPAETDHRRFAVSWMGTDDASGPNGSGVAFFDVFVSDNEDPFVLWLSQVPDTSAMFDGEYGHSYAFFSVAIDKVGHREAMPVSADTTTMVIVPPLVATDDEFEIDEDTVLDIGSKGVLTNDRLGDSSETLVVVPFTGTSQLGAAVAIDADGGFRYDPGILALQTKGRGEVTTDTFTYELRDALDRSATATVTITVLGINDWHNPRMALDVNKTNSVEPLDALIIINFLNDIDASLPAGIVGEPEFFWDTNDDGSVAPLDVLLIINELNNQAGPEGESSIFRVETSPLLDAGQSLVTPVQPSRSTSRDKARPGRLDPIWSSPASEIRTTSYPRSTTEHIVDDLFADEEALRDVLDQLTGRFDSTNRGVDLRDAHAAPRNFF